MNLEPPGSNYFRFARNELSHSAFWAWVLDSLNSVEPGLSDVRELATRVVASVGVEAPLELPIRVETESWLGSGERIDVLLTDAENQIVAIEVKVDAVPSAGQLNRYQVHLDEHPGKANPAIFSAAFDPDVRDALPWKYVGLEEQLDLFAELEPKHTLLADYFGWLVDRQALRRQVQLDALEEDPRKRIPALNTPEGNWDAMAHISNGLSGRQYRGMSRGGVPWTEFRFVEEEGDRDALFYRIDGWKASAFFSLRQYQRDPFPDLESKRNRFNHLRRLWVQASTEASAFDRFELRPVREKKSTEIARTSLKTSSSQAIKAVLAEVHPIFAAKLEA